MTFLVKRPAPRRRILRGMLHGAATTVALPFLDCFMNENGTALASGADLPVRYGLWLWGLGWQPGLGVSDKSAAIELLGEAKPLEPFKSHMNVFSGFNAPLDGKVNQTHYSGMIACRTGTAPSSSSELPAPTLDVLVSDVVGGTTRFRSLQCSGFGARASYSARSTASQNAAEASPLELYTKVFGPEFIDPNNAEFKPDPSVMVQQSVLSTVNEEAKRFAKEFGASDKQRMDEYFTSIRDTERALALQLQKPPQNEACKVPIAAGEMPVGTEMSTVLAVNKVMARVLAMALACNQTKVFTMDFSRPSSDLHKTGEAQTHHQLTHQEPVDPKLGYQPLVSWFNIHSMMGCADFIEAFATTREGDGTLLDNSLIFAHADVGDARTHAVDNIPMMTFGKAGGRIKTGLRVNGNGDPLTRVGLTTMQVMGVPVDTWGTKSLQTSKSLASILA